MTQTKDVRFSPAGLWTAPANVVAPKGGLLEAGNIVLRRPGLAEPRPGMPKTTVWTYNGTYTNTRRLIAGPGDTYLGVEVNGSASRVRWENSTEVLPPGGSTGDMVWQTGYYRGRRAQGNIYLTTKDGLRKVNETHGATAYKALPPTPAVVAVSNSSGVAVNAGYYVAYRAVTRRKDAAGLVMRSAPSGRALVTANSSAKQIGLDLLLHRSSSEFLAGDVIELYRTLNETTNPPSDTMYLVGEITLVAGDITAGYVAVTDNTPDTETQQALYTNENQGGAEAANGWPPACKAVELFNGSMFLGNVTYPPELELAWVAKVNGLASSGELGVHQPGAFAQMSVTNGSATITVDSTAGLKVGMIVVNSAPNWTGTDGYVTIASITNSTTLVLSNAWGGTTGVKDALFVDSITISDGTTSTTAPIYTVKAVLSSLRGVDLNSITEIQPVAPASPVTIDIIDDDTSFVTIFDYQRKRFLIRGLLHSATLSITATSGSQYTPVLPDTGSTAMTVTGESIPNGLAWSNNREPSHFPDAQFEQIGDDNEPILALHATRNALLVFKTDGVWRVSGAGSESGFRIDELDRNVRLVSPDAACTLGDKVFCWGDTGVFAGDENGLENISDQAISDLLHPLEVAIGVGSTSALGAWMCAGRREDEVFLSVPASSDLTVGERLYVWNKEQQGWTTWFSSASLRHGLAIASGLRVIDSTYVRAEADPNGQDYLPWLDEAIAVTVTSVVGTAVTIAGGSGWTPAVGDVLRKSHTKYARVTTVTDATHFTISNTTITAEALSAYVAWESRITPIASYGMDPGALKLWGDGSLVWDSLGDIAVVELAFTSSLSGTAVTTTREVTASTRGESWNFKAPRRHARCSRLYPSIRIRQAGANWAFSAVELQYRPTTGKARMR